MKIFETVMITLAGLGGIVILWNKFAPPTK